MADNYDNSFNGCDGCTADCGFNGSATVTLNLDNGTTQECAVMAIYKAGGRDYIALLPLDANGRNDDGEVYLYRFNDDGVEPQLDNIGDDAEYQRASDGFEKWLDDHQLDQLVYEETTETEEGPLQ